MAFDSKCYDLAETFLEDQPHLNTDRRRRELAQLIQDAIDDYIGVEDREYDPPAPPGFEAGFADNH